MEESDCFEDQEELSYRSSGTHNRTRMQKACGSTLKILELWEEWLIQLLLLQQQLARCKLEIQCNGGHITLVKGWAKYFLGKMHYVKRKATTKAKPAILNFEAAILDGY